ncbi:glycosyltransferase [Shewanella baltica]|uniref:glycosyltransferase n=1 Tax=Shewanella baltica TaxID=62322 RepID=UPI00217D0B1F|nr:glycosyltransferase [Shewanella baltica]MCS6175144.1 glycosyltransferase [Shewanella baltica]
MYFSVLMSIYNKENPLYFDKCLESIFKQSLKANEVVIVLDGPISNDLFDVIRKWKNYLPIKEYPLKVNVGLGTALSYGLLNCSHELVARMDTDDICLPHRFERQIQEFKNDAKLDICGSNILEVDPVTLNVISERKVSVTHSKILSDLVWMNPFNHMTVMYKRSSVIAVGSYIDLPWMEDWYLWLRLFSSGYKGANIDSSLVLARTGNNMIARRSGLKYIKSEWIMTKYKIGSKLFSKNICLLAFLTRSIPRFFPAFILSKIYKYSRR